MFNALFLEFLYGGLKTGNEDLTDGCPILRCLTYPGKLEKPSKTRADSRRGEGWGMGEKRVCEWKHLSLPSGGLSPKMPKIPPSMHRSVKTMH